jgi:hypothetical protein
MEWSLALEGGRPLGSLNTPSNRVRTPANGPGITGRYSVLRPSCWACVTLTSWASGKGRPTSCNSSPLCSILGSLKESPPPPSRLTLDPCRRPWRMHGVPPNENCMVRAEKVPENGSESSEPLYAQNGVTPGQWQDEQIRSKDNPL